MKRNFALVIALLILGSVVLCACQPLIPSDAIVVVFDAQNGTKPKTVVWDDKFEMPEDPSRTGYLFEGWYSTKNYLDGSLWQVPDTLEQSITLYAKWRFVGTQFYVTFNPQSRDAAFSVLYDENFQMPEDPVYGINIFRGWYVDKACTPGNEWVPPEKLTSNVTVYAKWEIVPVLEHDHDFDGNYLIYTECKEPGCFVIGRLDSTNSAKEKFVFTFDAQKKAEISSRYDQLVANLETGTDAAGFEALFEAYDADVSYVVEQYQFAYVFYCTYGDVEHTAAFEDVSAFYNQCVSSYYSTFRKVFESDYRESFFAGWSQETIEKALALSDSYGNANYKALKDQIDAINVATNEMVQQYPFPMDQFEEKYAELVPLNNSLAALMGYDNFMEYAYAEKFDRSYTPSEVATMRNYVKQYVVPALDELTNWFGTFQFTNFTSYEYYMALSGASVFLDNSEGHVVSNLVGEYFKTMRTVSGETELDFFQVANRLMQDGNYYTGQDDGAFSYYVASLDTGILYFGNTINQYGAHSYQNAFTFVHEFGHYFNSCHNGSLDLSMDLNETHSQGDEMMFLAWLKDHHNEAQDEGYVALTNESLYNALWTVCIATAVDEFEQAAYTGVYNGQPLPQKGGKVDYSGLFETILATYGSGVAGNEAYWAYVVFENAGYYVSYAISQLPCVELYVLAMKDFAAARNSYFKLFTFSSDSRFVTEVDGSKTVTASYMEILEYCGLKHPFQQQLYLDIYNYFVK